MKQTIIHILSIVLLIMAFPLDSSGNNREIDFNFPQDVSNEAMADLDKALKSGDGQLTVDALVRYSLAQSGISQDNAADIITRVETVIRATVTVLPAGTIVRILLRRFLPTSASGTASSLTIR